MDQVQAKQIFDKVEAVYRKQVWFPESRAWNYPLLAALTLATYHARHADAWPIIDIDGMTGSGKGQVVAVLHALAWRARPITVVPTVAQLYRYAHVKKGKEPKVTIWDEARVQSSQADVRAVLNAGVERGKGVPRMLGSKSVMFKPWGFKVLVHEEPLPRSMQSLHRRCIRVLTVRANDFVPALPRLRDVRRAAEALRPELERWHDAEIEPLLVEYLHNRGREKLVGDERPTWHLVLAVAEFCGRLDAVMPALRAHRAERLGDVNEMWRARALPIMQSTDPKARRASDLMEALRKRLGADMPPLNHHSMGKLLREAISRGELPWRERQLHGATVYERAVHDGV